MSSGLINQSEMALVGSPRLGWKKLSHANIVFHGNYSEVFLMTFPAFIFGSLLALLFGGIFHLWKGGGFGRVLLYLLLSFLGFWAGHFVFEIFEWRFLRLGPINLGSAIIGMLVFLLGGYWLSLLKVESP
jgi:hypothetical protein